jgi:hypothetical protein
VDNYFAKSNKKLAKSIKALASGLRRELSYVSFGANIGLPSKDKSGILHAGKSPMRIPFISEKQMSQT